MYSQQQFRAIVSRLFFFIMDNRVFDSLKYIDENKNKG